MEIKDMPTPAKEEFNVLRELQRRLDNSREKLNKLHVDLFRIERNIAASKQEHEFLTKLFRELNKVTRS